MSDNGKILSSQRSTEDQDLLERSTKKSKVNAANQRPVVPDSLASADDSQGSGSNSSPSDHPVADMVVDDDTVAETPVEIVPESPLEATTTPAVGDAGAHQGLEGENTVPIATPALPEGETCSVPPPPTGISAPNPDNTETTQATVAAPPSGGNASSSKPTRGGPPYGSWMIVTRKERRPAERPVTQGRQGDRQSTRDKSNGSRNMPPASGSRYAILESDADVVNQEPAPTCDIPSSSQQPQSSAEGLAEQRAGVANSRMGSRPRRANVVVNERQINNEPAAPTTSNAAPNSNREKRTPLPTSKRAAEEDEHVVV
nr:uncharacterized protein LOC109157027 [Ipomoea trifida]